MKPLKQRPFSHASSISIKAQGYLCCWRKKIPFQIVSAICAIVSFMALANSMRAATLWEENFESAGAQIDWAPTRGNWLIGPPSNTNGPIAAHSGIQCAATGLRGRMTNL